jgi:DNA replication protein DnaC
VTTSTTQRRPPAAVAAPAGDPFDEALSLTRRLRLPYLRKALTDVIPTARAQRWDPAELVRVLLAEEAAGRDEATIRSRRRRAGFPAGKTFDSWDENASSIPRPTQHALSTLEWVAVVSISRCK